MPDTETGRPDRRLIEAIEFLTRGAWPQAHALIRENESAEAAWLHGIVHTVEGDLENARYWYRKANRTFPGPGSVTAEIAAVREFVVGRMQARQGA